MQEKKVLLYNYIYYINTYLDKTIYKSGQPFFLKKIRKTLLLFSNLIIIKIQKTKIGEIKKKLIISIPPSPTCSPL